MADLKKLYHRQVKVMTARPSFAQVKGHAVARMQDGLACEVACGDFTVRADSPEVDGGGNSAPSPGQLMRAGLGACLAIGYRSWAERLGVPIEAIEVDITCELDARGQLGIAEVPVGWQRISWVARITSNAAETDIVRVLDQADRLSPMLASIDAGAERVRTIDVRRHR